MAKREMLRSEIETMSERECVRASLVIWESYGTEIMLAPGKGKQSGVSLIIIITFFSPSSAEYYIFVFVFLALCSFFLRRYGLTGSVCGAGDVLQDKAQ